MKKKQGFTLIELLLVIALLGILTVLGTASYLNSQRQGRNARKVQDLKAVQQALESYYTVNGSYPGGACDPTTTFLPQGMPINPSTKAAYAATSCSDTAYCFCAILEPNTTTAGNATASNCAFGAGPYTCVMNLQ
jgi:general secretion pathway protein G